MTGESLLELYRNHDGKVADKWHVYLAEYERLFTERRNQEIRLLEIGVQNGGSLEIWARYFPAAESIVGCDINPLCGRLAFEDPRIAVVVGDATSGRTQLEINRICSAFDIVIDDGSHTSGDVVKSFAAYFAQLADGGLYIIEDLHCGYWAKYGGGLFHPHSSVTFLKYLADIVNYDFWGVDRERTDLLAGFRDRYGVDLDPMVLQHIQSVEFANSMCIVRKSSVADSRLGKREVAGTQELVEKGPLSLPANFEIAVPSQSANAWASAALPPAEELPLKLRELADRSRQVETLQRQLAEVEVALEQRRQLCELRDAEIARLHVSRSWRLTSPLRRLWKRFNFDDAFYLEQNPDVAASGMDPFVHYEAYGRNEGRLPRPPGLVKRTRWTITAFRKSLQNEGGVAGSLRALASVYRGEGIPGIQERVGMVMARADRNNYEEWIRRFDTLTDSDRRRIQQHIKELKVRPLISVLMPTYNTRLEWLQQAVDSVRGQLYSNWELCIADDASTDAAVPEYLSAMAAADARIKVVFRKENGHISDASNSALELCTGEWVALLDHDDILAEHALYHVVEAINRDPDARLFYSDEDKISERGSRHDPYFKCDWNRDLFYSHNMISHLGVYQREILEAIGGFRAGFEGSQDHDLALRYIEHVEPGTIHHIPRVLYHWRKHQDSTAQHSTAKPYAMIAGEKAIGQHLERRGIDAEVQWNMCGYRVRYALPAKPPLVTLIIPTRNALHLIRTCVDSILHKTTYDPFEILIVDNDSDDPEVAAYFSGLDREERVRVIRDDRPFNFAGLNNAAVDHARGSIIGFVNNDIEAVSPDWLSEMVSLALQPGVGSVGAKLLYPDGSVQHAGVVLGIGGVANHAFKGIPGDGPGYFGRARIVSSYSAVTAACMVMRKDVFRAAGGFDEDNLPIAFNDVDLCLRVTSCGYRNVWTPYATLIHHESATRGFEDTVEKQQRFGAEVRYMQERWGELLLQDPAYSPNLTLDEIDFSLAWPPRTEYCPDPDGRGKMGHN